jgi:hypothetical protein
VVWCLWILPDHDPPEAPHTLAGMPAPQMVFQRPRYGARQIAAPIVLLAKGAMTAATD